MASSWEMDSPEGYPYKRVFLQCARKTKIRFTNSINNEIASLGKVKTQFGIKLEPSFLSECLSSDSNIFCTAFSQCWPCYTRRPCYPKGNAFCDCFPLYKRLHPFLPAPRLPCCGPSPRIVRSIKSLPY